VDRVSLAALACLALGCVPAPELRLSHVVRDDVHFVRRDADDRLLAIIGRDFEPGVMGVHHEVSFERFVVLSRSRDELVVEVQSEQLESDFDFAGLECEQRRLSLRTICRLGERAVCSPAVPVAIVVTRGPAAEPEAPDADTLALLQSIRARASRAHVTLAYVVGPDAIRVRIVEGRADLVPEGVVGDHPFVAQPTMPRWLGAEAR